MSKLIRIKYYENSIEANRDKQILAENRIESFIANEQTIQSDWLLSQAIGGLQLQVFIKKSTKLNISDQGCALKVFTNETAKELNLYGENHRFISLMAHLNGAKITEIPVKHHPRQHGVSKYGMNRTFKVINDLLLVLFNKKYLSKPIYLFGNIGLITFTLGVLVNIYLLALKILGNDIGGRPLLILGVLLIFIGIQFFTTGIIVDMLMKTYYESQEKRPFNIRNITTFGESQS
jgi:hypothetical protein